MKTYKKIILIILLLCVIFFLSCGVILDQLKLVGKWELYEVNFYVYNEITDSYKKISGINDLTPDNFSPIMGSFFFEKKNKITMELLNNNKFVVKGYNVSSAEEDIISLLDPGEWTVNIFENSITFKVNPIDKNSSNLWKRGVVIKNYWPFISNTVFKIYVKANDFNQKRFIFDLSEDKIDIYSMEAFFKKY